MRAWRDLGRDLCQMVVHGLGVAAGHDERRALSSFRADSPEDVGGRGSLIFASARPRSSLGPAARNLILLADAGLIRAPDFYVGGIDTLFAADLLQTRREVFLKSSIAPSAWA